MVLPNFLHLLNPPLALFVAVAPRLIDGVYKRFGAGGLLALPFVCLTLEKVTYDSFLAIRGYDMEAEQDAREKASGKASNAYGGFPSGGAQLPNLSLVAVRGEQDRLVLTWFGDEPREPPGPGACTTASAE